MNLTAKIELQPSSTSALPHPKRASGYLPSLDGWRAVAILGVIMAHDKPWSLAGHSNITWKGIGGLGVYLFFAISGILICWRILEDEAATGRFRLKAFYIRRLFRIQPAALLYLAVVALLIGLGIVHERWHFWLGSLFLYQNFLYHTFSWKLIMDGFLSGHFWTLSVEEHFYILLSLFLVAFRRYRIAAMLLLLLALVAAKYIAVAHGFYSEDTSTRRTYWILPYLLFPSLLALILRRPVVYRAAQKFLKPWVAYISIFVVLFLAFVPRHGLRAFVTHEDIARQVSNMVPFYGFLLIATMLHPRSWTTRLLELAPVRYLGRISYSIYVWHLLVFITEEPDTQVTWAPLVFIGQRPWKYIATLALAMLSYHFVEKPLIRLGHRLAPPATAGHHDLAGADLSGPSATTPAGEML